MAWAGFDYASMLSLDPDAVERSRRRMNFRVPKPGAAIYQTQGSDPAVRPLVIPVFFWEAGGVVPAPRPRPR